MNLIKSPKSKHSEVIITLTSKYVILRRRSYLAARGVWACQLPYQSGSIRRQLNAVVSLTVLSSSRPEIESPARILSISRNSLIICVNLSIGRWKTLQSLLQ